MRIFTYGEAAPNLPEQIEQAPLAFKSATSDEMLASKDKFPLVEDFELVIIDGRQNPPEKSFGSDIMAQFVNHTTGQRITYWDMYYIDTRPMDMKQAPSPAKGEVIEEIESGYHILITTDDAFVYVAYSQQEDEPLYTRYAKIPKDRYGSEWKAFIDWYHEHPEKRHPHPTPEERRAHSARNTDGSLKKQGNWLSRLFR